LLTHRQTNSGKNITSLAEVKIRANSNLQLRLKLRLNSMGGARNLKLRGTERKARAGTWGNDFFAREPNADFISVAVFIQCLSCRTNWGIFPNCVLTPLTHCQIMDRGVSYVPLYIGFTSQFWLGSDRRKFNHRANFSQFKHCVYQKGVAGSKDRAPGREGEGGSEGWSPP